MDNSAFSEVNIPEDNTVIWRYMNLERFKSLLKDKALYFGLLSEMREKENGDKWEAAISAQLEKSLHALHSHKGKLDSPLLESTIHLIKKMHSVMAINCWHKDEGESVAMWELYTKHGEGVAIRSTVGDLRKAIPVDYYPIIGEVVYKDHNAPYDRLLTPEELGNLGIVRALFQKRSCYEYEREVRVAIRLATPEEPSSDGTYPDKGTLVRVFLKRLIHSVVMGPGVTTESCDEIKGAMTEAGLQNVALFTSTVETAPN